MPGFWGRGKTSIEGSSSAPGAGRADRPPPSVADATGTPLGEDTSFRIDDVYDIMGEGCVVVGTLEKGRIRPPAALRLRPGPGSVTAETTVQVVKAMVRHEARSELGPGETAGLTLRGVAPRSHLRRTWEVRTGDELVNL